MSSDEVTELREVRLHSLEPLFYVKFYENSKISFDCLSMKTITPVTLETFDKVTCRHM